MLFEELPTRIKTSLREMASAHTGMQLADSDNAEHVVAELARTFIHIGDLVGSWRSAETEIARWKDKIAQSKQENQRAILKARQIADTKSAARLREKMMRLTKRLEGITKQRDSLEKWCHELEERLARIVREATL